MVSKYGFGFFLSDLVVFYLCFTFYPQLYSENFFVFTLLALANLAVFIRSCVFGGGITSNVSVNFSLRAVSFLAGNQFVWFLMAEGDELATGALVVSTLFYWGFPLLAKSDFGFTAGNSVNSIKARFRKQFTKESSIEAIKNYLNYDSSELSKEYYYNREYAEKLGKVFEKIMVYEKLIASLNYAGLAGPSIDWDKTVYNKNSYRAVYDGLAKGINGEIQVMKLIRDAGLSVVSDSCFKVADTKIEVDAAIVTDDAIYLFEVKNYDVQTVTLTSGGSLFKVQGDKEIPMDTLSQVTRHRNVIRNIVGTDIEIVNVIVLASGAVVTDNLNSPNLKLMTADALPFFLSMLKQTNNEKRAELLSLLKEHRADESKFEFPNLGWLESKVDYEVSKLRTWLGELIQLCDDVETFVQKDYAQLDVFVTQGVRKRYDVAREDAKDLKGVFESVLASLN